MKKLIIASLLIVGMTSFAQEIKEKPNRAKIEKMSPEQRSEKHLERLTKELNLNAKQKEQMAQVLAEQNTKREALRKQMHDDKTATDNKMKSILSAEQYEKWSANKEKNKRKLKGRRAQMK